KFQMSLEKVRDTRFNPPFPTMNIGGSILIGRVRRGEKMKFSDKVAKNIIPRGFVIEGDIRPVPGQDPQDLINIIRSNIKNRVAGIKTTVADEEIKTKVGCPTNKSPSYPMETPRNSAVVSLAEEVSGYPAETAAFNTEGNAFNKAGCEAIIWGPSDILQAHSDDEYVLAEFFNKETIEKYMLLLRRICT
ncbi:MAG: peptidase dimerization domain-containing protein, partial [bacterium]|nr:peptidase dimerization domain-containing protein [bacterium]